MNKTFEFALRPEVKVVLDIDGTLAVYEFGDLRHSACHNDNWEEFVRNNHPYDTIPAVPQFQAFVRDKARTEQGRKNLFICSVSEEYERQNKKNFVQRNYPEIPEENIIFVNSKAEKMDILHKLSQEYACSCGSEIKGEACDCKTEHSIIIIDDTVKTLDNIFENSDYCTLHNSSFFTYPLDGVKQ